jgi:plasmanylethanolamine desaturase
VLVRPELLPKHDVMGAWTRAVEAGSIAAALVLIALNAARFATEPRLVAWWLPLVLVAGVVAADFASGVVHWTADTWGRESLPVVGIRFLRPFRIHHVNPDDLCERDFIDCNGDVALLVCPLLLGSWLVPLESDLLGATSLLTAVFGAATLPTNQVHQWAHMPRPPRLVAWLQRRGWILSRAAHQRHHAEPYTASYCITTGWCNRALDRLGFFRAAERVIARVTGLVPRDDERDYVERRAR